MEVVIGKWGNGAALRIPKSFMSQMKLNIGDNVQFSINNEQLVISKAGPTLDELLRKCSESNRHDEYLSDIRGQEIL